MRHRILVVDDEPASVRAVQRTLTGEAEVLTAPGGEQAWRMLCQEAVALVVADQRMPDMLGTELFARTSASYPHVVRVLLTGYTDTDTLLDAINAGHVFYYITKPWTAPELRLVVRRGLERYEAGVERERLYGELEKACGQLRREVERQRRLLTLAAHELGTPLHLVGSALELLADSSLGDAERDWLAMARRNVEWLARGLSQMLAAGRWQCRELPIRRARTDVGALVAAARRRFEAVRSARHLEWSWHVAAGLPSVSMDPDWMSRALDNLLSNAVRFTPDGGWIRISADVFGHSLRLRVADGGVGIAPTAMEEIFEPFAAAAGDVLLHGSGLWQFGARGLGLGLATAKAIVEQHGGRIDVESREGQGSCFTISVPLEEIAAVGA